MISVDEALAQLFALATPLPVETVGLEHAVGRVMVKPAQARRDQPPFHASAMDGYAVRQQDTGPGATLTVIGEAAAGHRFEGTLGAGQAVRIFTGAPLPEGADTIVIQEDVTRSDASIALSERAGTFAHIRPQGQDFSVGDHISAPRRLTPADIALLASMNVPRVEVTKRPDVALISTGDELVLPGETPGPDQIIASNTFGLKAMLEEAGAQPRILPIARDNRTSLETAFGFARDADLVVTIGGASVGDHDLVGDVAADLGMDRSFYKVRMRPGKPLMAGRFGQTAMVGLPGNPVSALVCGHIFLLPMLRAMLGLGAAPAPRLSAPLAVDMPEGGPREHYMRATFENGMLTPADNQDSSLLTVFSAANALLIRPPQDQPRARGDRMDYIPF